MLLRIINCNQDFSWALKRKLGENILPVLFQSEIFFKKRFNLVKQDWMDLTLLLPIQNNTSYS